MESRAKRPSGDTRTRSRQGCANCRRSKVKCDEQKPSCTRCWQKDLQCFKDDIRLKWEADFQSRGVAFGRTGVWRKSNQTRPGFNGVPRNLPAGTAWLKTPEIRPWNFLSSDFSLVQRLYREEQNDIEPHLLPAPEREKYGPTQSTRTLNSPLSLPPFSDRLIKTPLFENQEIHPCLSLFPSLNELGNPILFDYYINQICPRMAPSPASKSPFASVILPYCLSATRIVLRAIQAVAACHWSQYDSNYSRLGLQLKSKVLAQLRRQIAIDPQCLVAEDPEILVVVMLLCLFDIVDHCDWQWILHLQGAKDIIRLRRRHRLASSNPSVVRQEDTVSEFVELFFAFQDVMGRTACAKADLFGASYWDDKDTFINSWMGCSPALVSILFAIMDLSRSRRVMVSDSDKMTFAIEASSLNTKLQDLVQHLDATTADSTLETIAELKNLTCRVYLQCALYDGKPSDSMIKSNVRDILKGVTSLVEQGSVSHVIWPLFVAAVELDPLDHELWSDPDTGAVTDGRVLVLSLLAKIAKASVSSVSRTRAVIEQIWQTRDFNISKGSVPSRAPSCGLNDWEHYIVPVSDALSLV